MSDQEPKPAFHASGNEGIHSQDHDLHARELGAKMAASLPVGFNPDQFQKLFVTVLNLAQDPKFHEFVNCIASLFKPSQAPQGPQP